MPIAIIALVRLGPRKAASAIARIRNGIASIASMSAHQHAVDDAAEIARRQARAAPRPRVRCDTETTPGQERGAAAPDDARENVAAEFVGAERDAAPRAACAPQPSRSRAGRRVRPAAPRAPARQRTAMTASPAIAARRRNSWRSTRRHGGSPLLPRPRDAERIGRHARSLGLTSHIGDIGQQIEQRCRRSAVTEHDALHDRVVAVEHGIDDQLAEARDREDLLGQHRARQQRAEIERAQA